MRRRRLPMLTVRSTMREMMRSDEFSDEQKASIRKVLRSVGPAKELRDKIEKANASPEFEALGDGQLLQRLWEKRHEIMAFILEVVKAINGL